MKLSDILNAFEVISKRITAKSNNDDTNTAVQFITPIFLFMLIQVRQANAEHLHRVIKMTMQAATESQQPDIKNQDEATKLAYLWVQISEHISAHYFHLWTGHLERLNQNVMILKSLTLLSEQERAQITLWLSIISVVDFIKHKNEDRDDVNAMLNQLIDKFIEAANTPNIDFDSRLPAEFGVTSTLSDHILSLAMHAKASDHNKLYDACNQILISNSPKTLVSTPNMQLINPPKNTSTPLFTEMVQKFNDQSIDAEQMKDFLVRLGSHILFITEELTFNFGLQVSFDCLMLKALFVEILNHQHILDESDRNQVETALTTLADLMVEMVQDNKMSENALPEETLRELIKLPNLPDTIRSQFAAIVTPTPCVPPPVDVFRRYVARNSQIPKIVAELETAAGAARLESLQQAIGTLSFKHPIFKDPDCLYLVQTLFQQNRISDEQRQTLMMYLSALQSFTDWQTWTGKPENTEHLAVEYITPQHSEYGQLLAEYLSSVSCRVIDVKTKTKFHPLINQPLFNHLKDLSIPAIMQIIAQLPPSEQGFITLQVPPYFSSLPTAHLTELVQNSELDDVPAEQEHSAKIFKTIIANRITCLFPILADKKIAIIPSMSLMNAILCHINPQFIQRTTPILGRISETTLFSDFLSQDRRPYSIHSTAVKNNPANIHGELNDPFSIALHDWFHLQVTALTTNYPFYCFLKSQLAPFILALSEFNQSSHLVESSTLSSVREAILDFGMPQGGLHDLLTRTLIFSNPELLMFPFIAACQQLPLEARDFNTYKTDFIKKHGQVLYDEITNHFSNKSLSSWQRTDFEWIQQKLSLISDSPMVYTPSHSAAKDNGEAAATTPTSPRLKYGGQA